MWRQQWLYTGIIITIISITIITVCQVQLMTQTLCKHKGILEMALPLSLQSKGKGKTAGGIPLMFFFLSLSV